MLKKKTCVKRKLQNYRKPNNILGAYMKLSNDYIYFAKYIPAAYVFHINFLLQFFCVADLTDSGQVNCVY